MTNRESEPALQVDRRSLSALRFAAVACLVAGVAYVLGATYIFLALGILYIVGSTGLFRRKRYGGHCANTAAVLTGIVNVLYILVSLVTVLTEASTSAAMMLLAQNVFWLIVNIGILILVSIARPRWQGSMNRIPETPCL